MVYMGGHVSADTTIRPSVAVLLRGKMTSAEFAMYVVSQCVGAIVAALVVYAVLGKTFAPAPAATATVTSAVTVELLYTFALALVVLNSAVSAKTHGNSFYGLAIGFTIVVAAFAGGPISGGAFNPAVGFGPIVVSPLLGGESLGNLWIYWVGPLAGRALATGVFASGTGTDSGARGSGTGWSENRREIREIGDRGSMDRLETTGSFRTPAQRAAGGFPSPRSPVAGRAFSAPTWAERAIVPRGQARGTRLLADPND